MLRRSIIWWELLHGTTIHNVSDRLSQLLNPEGKLRSNLNKDDLKACLRRDVIPIMRGNAYDSVLPSDLVKRDLCLLCREAAYSAAVLEANPHGVFVQSLVRFIADDSANMNFVQRMTTTQVTKIIEYLSFIQLDFSDAEKCFPTLISRLNFKHLQNLSRVMFCLSERGYTDLNVRLIIPAYPGGKWSSEPVGDNAQYSPPSEAVRVLRALSKSARMYIEKYYPLATTEVDLLDPPKDSSQNKQGHRTTSSNQAILHPFPLSSFHIFRSHLLEFILSHAHKLRGAHWVNFSRALLHFPPSLQTLTGFEASPELLQCLSVNISSGGGASYARRQEGHSVSSFRVLQWKCSDIAEYAIANVFAHVDAVEKEAKEREHKKHASPTLNAEEKEGHRDDNGSRIEMEKDSHHRADRKLSLRQSQDGEKEEGGGEMVVEQEKTKCHTFGAGSLAGVRDAFDCNPADLLKLLQQLAAFPPSPTMDARIQKLVQSLVQGSSDLSFENTVKLLSVVRALPCITHAHECAPAIAKVAGEKLLERPVKMVLRKEKFSTIVQLAIMIYACRIKDVPGFVTFMRNAVIHISPKELTLDYVVSFLNSLSVLKIRPSDASITLNLVNKVVENTASSHPLLKHYPEQAVKILRAFVLQSITPPVSLLEGLFGKAGIRSMYPNDPVNLREDGPSSPSSSPLPHYPSSRLFEASAVILFDISRSLAYVARHSREIQRRDLEDLAWEVGVKETLLPILLEWNHITRCHPAKKDYVPLSWRTSLETLSTFLDVTLDTLSLKELTMRITSIYGVLKDLLSGAAVCTHKQLSALLSLSIKGRIDRLHRIAFKNNTMIHFISSMLSFEYVLCQAAWQEAQHYTQLEGKYKEKSKDKDSNSRSDKNANFPSLKEENEVGVLPYPPDRPLAALLKDYKTNFLYKPVKDIEDPRKTSILSFSPMQVIQKIFCDDKDNVKPLKEEIGSTASQGAATGGLSSSDDADLTPALATFPTFFDSSSQNHHSQPVLLNRDQILEITTHLPFSIALVMNPGPINDYFTEKSYSAMVAGVKI